MKVFKAQYRSMTATYDLGQVYAETQEEAERIFRSKATAFSASEKSLIRVYQKDDNR